MSAMGGMAGMPGMSPMNGGSERMPWGGMVGAGSAASPYGPPDHHSFHQQNLQQQHQQHAQYLQQQHQHQQRAGPYGGPRMVGPTGVPMSGGGPMGGMAGMGAMAGMPGMPGMGGMAGMGGGMHSSQGLGGPFSKKKMKKVAVPVVKDKNCPKRPRNSYIFFTLMKR